MSDKILPFKEVVIPAAGPIFFLTAAEHSGDALGASLIAALRRVHPQAEFVGVGGERMAAVGCRLLADPVKRSAMLAGALLTESRYWWRLLRQIREEIARLKPAVVIPIDSSFINLRIAATAKKLGAPVCYYVAPQVWASRPWRVKKIAACVDTLCCMYPFEEQYFQDRRVHAVYVGHPMFDRPTDVPTDSVRNRSLPELPAGEPKIALFPGSRRAEVAKHMPAMLEIAAEIKGRFPKAVFVAAAPSEERAQQIRGYLTTTDAPIDIRTGDADAIIAWADLALTKSGTATLQIARQIKPMVVMFAVPRWQWAIARHFILTPHIALVNILAKRQIVPEFIPFFGKSYPVAEACIDLLSNNVRREVMLAELRAVVRPLMPADGRLAADRVAAEVTKLMKG